MAYTENKEKIIQLNIQCYNLIIHLHIILESHIILKRVYIFLAGIARIYLTNDDKRCF